MTVLPKVLALSAAILGLFLLYTFLLPSSTPCQYNIGCYLAPHSLNNTAQLQARIVNAKSQLTPIAYEYRSVVGNEQQFQKKMLGVAYSFQKYVQQLSKQQELRQQDRQIVGAINEAQKTYKQCKGQIDATINKTSCSQNWKDQVQGQLDQLFEKQDQVQGLISGEIERPQINPEDSPQIVAQRIYNQSMKINDAALDDFRTRLGEAQSKLNEVKELKDKAQDRFQAKDHTYKECFQNRRIYRQCQEISEQVKNLNMGHLKQLQQQLQAKKRLVEEMRVMLVRMGKGQNRKLPDHWSQMYQTHIQEYKQMHKDYIHYNTQMERKACGCTETQQIFFHSQVEKEKSIIRQYEVELAELEKVVAKLRKNVQDKEQERDRIISEYQKALKEYETTAPEKRQSQLIKLKKKLEGNRQAILNTEHTFKQIDDHCKAIKRRLAKSVKDIDRVQECMTKKEYLRKLKKATSKYLQPSRSLEKLMESKRSLIDSLTALQL